VALSVHRPPAEVRAEHDRPIVGRLGDDRHRPGNLLPGVIGQVRQQFDDGPVPDNPGGHRLDPCVALGQGGLTPPNELP
jgi:hypothetical protein